MTSWRPEGLSPRGPLYLAIADALAADVRRGRLKPGERLPTHRDLARALGVNVVTATRAYAEAARRGLTEGEVGRGTFVRTPEPKERVFLPLSEGGAPLVDFHFNVPAGDPRLLDPAPVLAALAREPTRALFHTNYVPRGHAAHRAAGAEWMARSGVEAVPERTFVCSGAQHALAVTLATLMEPGAVLLTEALTYPGIRTLAQTLHARTHGLALDEHGLVPEALEEACKRGIGRVLYVLPTLQNPTSVVMPLERRRKIADLARRYGLVIVEDDTTGFAYADAPPPIASLAPELTYFVTSLSKSLYEGLRIGYLLAPASNNAALDAERLEATVAALTWMTPPLMAELATRWIRSGEAARMVEYKRAEARARWDLVRDALADVPTPSVPGSCFAWLYLPDPWRGADFVARAQRAGVAVTGAEAFVAGRATAPHAVRLSHSTPAERQEVERGLAILADVLRAGPGAARALV